MAAAILAITASMGAASAAAPSVDKNTEVFISHNYNTKKQEMTYGIKGTIVLKGVKKNAEIISLEASNPKINPFEIYGKMASGKKGWQVIVNSNYGKTLDLGSFTVSIEVKQDGKTYNLSTICSCETLSPFKSIKINGKNVLGQFKPGYETVELKLAGKKLKVSCRFKKGFKGGGFMVVRKNRLISRGKSVKLKKGDLILIEYAKKGWRKSESYYVIVK